MSSASGYRVVDCTQVLDTSNASYLPGGQPLQRCPFNTHQASGFANEVWIYGCDQGTHTDSPAHFIEDGKRIHQIEVSTFVAVGVVIDVQRQCGETVEYAMTLADVHNWERENGAVPEGAIVCMRTGWSRKFKDQASYRNMGPDGKMRFPGFSTEAADYLVNERNVTGLGVDTFSPDIGSSNTWPIHHLVLGAGRILVENMILEELPPKGFTFVSLPLKIYDAPESPTHVVALLHESEGAAPLQVASKRSRVVDCTHTLNDKVPFYPGAQPFITFPAAQVPTHGYCKKVFCSGSDLGTHVDSPMHFFPDGRSITDLSAERELVAPGCVIDVRAQCEADPDYALSVEDILSWESLMESFQRSPSCA